LAKTKKTVPIRKKTYMVEGPGCKSKETGGFLCKKHAAKGGDGPDPLDQDPVVAAARGHGVAG
jgi:hypothetical protein